MLGFCKIRKRTSIFSVSLILFFFFQELFTIFSLIISELLILPRVRDNVFALVNTCFSLLNRLLRRCDLAEQVADTVSISRGDRPLEMRDKEPIVSSSFAEILLG